MLICDNRANWINRAGHIGLQSPHPAKKKKKKTTPFQFCLAIISLPLSQKKKKMLNTLGSLFCKRLPDATGIKYGWLDSGGGDRSHRRLLLPGATVAHRLAERKGRGATHQTAWCERALRIFVSARSVASRVHDIFTVISISGLKLEPAHWSRVDET